MYQIQPPAPQQQFYNPHHTHHQSGSISLIAPPPPPYHRPTSSFGLSSSSSSSSSTQPSQQPQYSTPPDAYYPQPQPLRHSRSFYNANTTGIAAPQPFSSGYIPPPPHMSNLQSHHQSQSMMTSVIAPPYMSSPPPPPPQDVSAPAPAAQDEQVNGGINSVLEYDLNTMAAFLSWCSFGMLKQDKNPTADFESLVVSVLFATRLPKSTIIIALEYMNQRFSNKNNHTINSDLTEHQIFINLIVSLILANKFNDDNTFTNKSWHGATGLKLELLNLEEKNWLDDCKWSLNVVNFESNIVTLQECWITWLDKYGDKKNSVGSNNAAVPSSPPPISQQQQQVQAQVNHYNSNSISSKNSYSSIPSSPIYSDHPHYYYPSSSSPSITPPAKYSDGNSLWFDHHQQQSQPLQGSQSIWNNFNNTTPNIAFQPQQVPHPHQQHQPQIHFQAPPLALPLPLPSNSSTSSSMYPFHHNPILNHGGFVGYANPYYMASC